MAYTYKFLINCCAKDETIIDENGIPICFGENIFSYKFSTHNDEDNLLVSVAENCAVIEWKVKKEYRHLYELLGNESRRMISYLRDPLRKCHIIHVLNFNHALKINNVTVLRTHNETTVFSFGTVDGSSLMPTSLERIGNLGLRECWKDPDIIRVVIRTPKSTTDYDRRIVSMFSFLSSKSKSSPVDKLTRLWTSINSFYTFLSNHYDRKLKELSKEFFSGNNSEEYLSREKFESAFRCGFNDAMGVTSLAWQIPVMDNAYVGKEKDPIEIQRENIGSVVSVGDQEHLNMLTPFSHSNKEQNNRGENKFLNYQYELERLFLSIDEENYPELYDEAYNRIVCTAMDTIPSKEGLTPVLNKIQDLFDEMMKENKNLEDVTLRVPLFYYLCFWYPYLWRCLLVHGSHIDELFLEHNSAEEKTLKIMSYFLERFLNDHIPLIFNEDYLNGEWVKTCLPIAFYVRWKSGAISYSFKKKSDRNKANYTAMAFYDMLTKK